MKNIRKEMDILKYAASTGWDLPTPSLITYYWNFGSILGICLLIQIITGLFLSFHYVSSTDAGFESVELMMREVWGGWLLRYTHMNGASMFFMFIYMHLFRGLFFSSSSMVKVWISGVTIMILLMAISFLGYVLPWGQMSYWAVAVITNLFSVMPIVGENMVHFIWGGFSVGSPTLTRFYSLHFLLPFMLLGMVIMHIYFLHSTGSSNPLGVSSNLDKIQFHPFFIVKDSFFLLLFLMMFLIIIFYVPFLLGDPVNNVPAMPMQTPQHIQPEWYFLCSYAILRSFSSKTAGVAALFLSVSMFYFLSFYSFKFSMKFSPKSKASFWVFLFCFLYLIKMGSMVAEEPYIMMSKTGSIIYFSIALLMFT